MNNTFYSDFDFAGAAASKARPGEYRTPFELDRDRIIHTSSFRRLQSKTQVFLSGEYDFYRTRLTHSIEVAQIGRSICARLRRTSDLLSEDYYIDPDLVEAACLAHDIGHPPFGHTGERTLHRLMRPYGGFEGNAQTLRILTQTIFSHRQSGMNPSRALTDGVLKYKTLFSADESVDHHFLYNEQKSDLDFVFDGRDFPADLSPGKQRNAFHSIECQIMDWADDTAYSLNDLVDGINAGFITLEKLERWAADQDLSKVESDHIDELAKAIREEKAEVLMGQKIAQFIEAATLRKDQNFMSAQSHRYQYALQVDATMAAESKLYKRLAMAVVFKSSQLQQLDKKADFIVQRLFGMLAEYYILPGQPSRDHFCLLSERDEQAIFSQPEESGRARLVCDVIARMTDGRAARMYQRLFDPSFGSIVDLD
ncbi:MAG: dNTP triphosphohydrolase [Verrucomicrobiales bacterium]|nr:dNTP triphosphohydrolase [Verrucomicrobiales bacterium]